MVEVGLVSRPVGAEGVDGVWDPAVGVAGFDELDRGGTLPEDVGIVRSDLRACRAALTDCFRSRSVPIVAVEGARRCMVNVFQIEAKSI